MIVFTQLLCHADVAKCCFFVACLLDQAIGRGNTLVPEAAIVCGGIRFGIYRGDNQGGDAVVLCDERGDDGIFFAHGIAVGA